MLVHKNTLKIQYLHPNYVLSILCSWQRTQRVPINRMEVDKKTICAAFSIKAERSKQCQNGCQKPSTRYLRNNAMCLLMVESLSSQ